MSCREEILEAIRSLGKRRFTPQDIIDEMERRGTKYRPSTIRTHVTSWMVAHAPHGDRIAHDDLYRIRKGLYRLATKSEGRGHSAKLRKERDAQTWSAQKQYSRRGLKFIGLKAEPIHRLKVSAGEQFITTRGAAEILGLTVVRVQRLAREEWPAIKLSASWLIDYVSVLAYRKYAMPRGVGPDPMKSAMNYLLPRSEMMETRSGVITTAATIIRSFGLSWGGMIYWLKSGLKAQRFGTEIIIYEDDWWEFVRNEWERPRLKRPWQSFPKPKGVILGPIIPSPMRQLPGSKRRKGQYAGWTKWYVDQLMKGKPPEVPEPKFRRKDKRSRARRK